MLKINLKIKGFHPIYLDKFILISKNKLKNFQDIEYSLAFLPKKVERFTVLKSPHVDKKAREQFERVTYNRLLTLKMETFSSDTYLKLYQILKITSSLVKGVDFEIKFVVTK